MKKIQLLAFVLAAHSAIAQTWTGGGDGLIWDSAANWNPASVPVTGANVVINATPTIGNAEEAPYLNDRVIALTSNDVYTLSSFTFDAALTAGIKIISVGAESFKINGNIVNASAFTQTFVLPVEVGATSTISGALAFQNLVDAGLQTLNVSTGANISFSNSLRFEIGSSSSFGKFLGSGFTMNFSGVTINIGGAYVGGAGDTFDFTTGNFSGATLGTLPTLSGGLVWNTSNFLTDGTLSVSAIPEPSTYAVLLGLSVLGFGAVRRRRRA